MAFRAKVPPGGLRAAVARNLADKQQPQDHLTLESEEIPAERFKTVRLAAEDYEGADESAGNCPVSHAIRRALKKGPETSINVWVDKVRIGGHCYALPAEVTEADAAWTRGKKVTELEFQLSNKRVSP